MEPHLRLYPGQQTLTPAQEAEARRFANERIQAQLATSPVDEPEAEAFLRQVYQVAKLPPPQRILWVDGPLQLVAVLASHRDGASVVASLAASVRESVHASVWASVGERLWVSVWVGLRARVRASVVANVHASVHASVEASVRASIGHSVGASVDASVRAYARAPWLTFFHFFAAYLTPNDLHALAHFNELVSGYWLSKETAVLVRRPQVLSRDEQGRLHSTSGKCIEYRDGWGFSCWHGVRVPEKVILAPDTLTRDDFFNEEDSEVRRVMQERMGSRFVAELGGQVIDRGPRGVLYEVALPDDPERVAHSVQVQDASTPRQYFLRVPPTIQTAAEAVAWSFGLPVEAYHPTDET